MDLWGVIRIMLRRWYVALPILLATGYLAVTSSGTVSQTFNASTTMIMLGPSLDTFTDAKGVTQTVAVNPYLNVPSTATLVASTLALKESSASARQGVARAGLSPSYTIVVGKTPVMDVAVEATSSQLALDTVKYVSELLKTDLQAQQDGFNINAISRLNLQTVVPADTLPTTTASTKMRVRITILGFGGVLAVAGALAFEGLAEVRRNRGRRRAERRDEADAETPSLGSAGMTAGATHNPGN
ncbi:MAG: hypothetical protein ABI912_04395 [Actinomycetota bacterium]